MIGILVILLSLIAIVVSFFTILWAWILLALPVAFLLLTLFGLKRKRWQRLPELSPSANARLQKYGHFYAMPFAGKDFSSAASALTLAGAIVAIIGAFKGFWWGLALGGVNYVLTAQVAKAFNPTSFLADPLEESAHAEIIALLAARRGESKPDA